MFTFNRSVSVYILLTVLLLGLCCAEMRVGARQRRLPGSRSTSTTKPTASQASPMQVAQALDTYVQPRFQVIDNTDFGMSRIVYRKHSAIVRLKADTVEEKQRLASINAANRDYTLYLLRCVSKPGQVTSHFQPMLNVLYSRPNPPVFHENPRLSPRVFAFEAAQQSRRDWQAVQNKMLTVLPALMAGREQRAETRSWELLMRPVRASKPECLSCHKNARIGATLGVMVYAVCKTKRSEIAQVQEMMGTNHRR